MTHDELLTRIEDKFNNHSVLHEAQIVNALYRVVELHKEKLDDVGRPVCSGCMTGSSWRIYPCPTIQAIEKEIG